MLDPPWFLPSLQHILHLNCLKRRCIAIVKKIIIKKKTCTLAEPKHVLVAAWKMNENDAVVVVKIAGACHRKPCLLLPPYTKVTDR